jgi:hypothetical protein
MHSWCMYSWPLASYQRASAPLHPTNVPLLTVSVQKHWCLQQQVQEQQVTLGVTLLCRCCRSAQSGCEGQRT